MSVELADLQKSYMPDEATFKSRLSARHRRGAIGKGFYYFSIGVAILALVILFLNIINEAVGTIAVQNEVEPETLTPEGKPLSDLTPEEYALILEENLANRLRVVLRDELSQVEPNVYTSAPIREVLAGQNYPEEIAELTVNDLDATTWANLLTANLSTDRLRQIVLEQIVNQQVLESWPLFDTIFNYNQIVAVAAEEYPDAELAFRSWLSRDFLTNPMSSVPANAGIRIALLGSIYIMIIVIIVSLPIGVGTAIYLEEYAGESRLNSFIETNVRNLAGVPSIIYGMLGLAIFVRALETFTSGSMFGITDSNGRTIISAGLTLALLILPIIIINAQEALRAVPRALREASFGLGGTQWQTIWRTTLPAAVPGILTGAILAVSRAVGETAPLIVVGASTFLLQDPDSPFSKFTALPIQIFQWTARPQDQFRDIAAAAIVVLLILLLTLNATAIILRNRYSIDY